jgi:hypothetical protein
MTTTGGVTIVLGAGAGIGAVLGLALGDVDVAIEELVVLVTAGLVSGKVFVLLGLEVVDSPLTATVTDLGTSKLVVLVA